jgi:hypothetical protein
VDVIASLLYHWIIRSFALPFVVALLGTGALRLLAGPVHGPRMAGAAVILAFLVAAVGIMGVPLPPPTSASGKVLWIALGAATLGVLVASLRAPRPLARGALVLASGLSIAWLLGWTPPVFPEVGLLGRGGALWLGLGAALDRLYRVSAKGSDGAVMLTIAAAGTAAIALLGGAVTLARLAGALAAAAAGFLVWSWPLARYPLGGVAVFGAGMALAGLVAACALHPGTSRLALLALLAVFFADAALRRLPLPGGELGDAVRTLALAGVCLMPAAAAVLVAYIIRLVW